MKEQKIFEAITKIMAELEAVGKTKKADPKMGGYAYRGIDDVYNALQKLMAKHGVFNVPEVINRMDSERKSNSGNTLYHTVLTVKYKFYAVDGSFIEATVHGEGLDSGDKRSNKALSGAHKYALYQVFTMATEDLADPDDEHVEQDGPPKVDETEQVPDFRQPELSDKQLKRLYAISKKQNWKPEEVKSYMAKSFKKNHSDELTKTEYDILCRVIENSSYADAVKE